MLKMKPYEHVHVDGSCTSGSASSARAASSSRRTSSILTASAPSATWGNGRFSGAGRTWMVSPAALLRKEVQARTARTFAQLDGS